MTRTGILILGITVGAMLASPAIAAGRVPGGGGLLPRSNPEWEMQRRMMLQEPARSPYPRNYAEEVAESLGVRKGQVDLVGARDIARNPYAPSVSMGAGALLRLRWRQ